MRSASAMSRGAVGVGAGASAMLASARTLESSSVTDWADAVRIGQDTLGAGLIIPDGFGLLRRRVAKSIPVRLDVGSRGERRLMHCAGSGSFI